MKQIARIFLCLTHTVYNMSGFVTLSGSLRGKKIEITGVPRSNERTCCAYNNRHYKTAAKLFVILYKC